MILYKSKSIDELFALQVKEQPDAAAVGFNHQQISYRELNQKVDEIAGKLKKSKIAPENVAAIYLNSFIDFTAGILGILKAGGCCLPLHFSWSLEYMNRILQSSKPKHLLAEKHHIQTIPFKFKGKILVFDDPGDRCDLRPGKSAPTDFEQPMAVFYSSHSSGKPEGVTLSHKNILNWITFNLKKLKIDFSQTLFISHSSAFSSARMETGFPIWLASLVSGGYVYFYQQNQQKNDEGISELIDLVNEKNFKSIICPLYFLQDLIHSNHYKNFFPVKISNIVSLGEETFDAAEFKNFLKEKKIRWHNYFGFPEMNMVTTVVEDNTQKEKIHKHIGIPGADTHAFVLDGAGKLTAPGIKGELYVCGNGVMSQYHQNEELNRAHFVKHSIVSQNTIYKTGYLAAWLPDGKISILGRTDNRVHLKGCRMALEEIEYLFSRHPSVKDCAVTLKKRADGRVSPRVEIFIVLKEEIPLEQIESYLKNYLPQEIFPLGFIEVSSIPRKDDGTVDRKYLENLNFLDTLQVKSLEEEIKNEPGIQEAAIIVKERVKKPSPLYVKDFLPPAHVYKAPTESAGDIKESAGLSISMKDKVKIDDEEIPMAIIHGQELKPIEGEPQILPDALKRAAAQNENNGILYIHSDGSEHFQSYKDLMKAAQQVLAGLRHMRLKAGDKVIFQFNRDEDYTAAFWGSQLGGIIPVPIMVPRSFNQPTNETAMLYNVWETLDRPIILTNQSLKESLILLSGYYDFDPSRVITIEHLREHEPDHQWHQGSSDDLALLLFTSGSTGVPKGVMQPHRTILAREKGTIRHNDFNSSDVSLNWMPLEHVGGVVMFHIRDIYCCCSQVQVRTDYILSSPLRWLDIIDKHKVTITWAPNFAYGLVNEQMEQLKASGVEKHWDLSSMKFILNGGEAVNAVTVKGFLNRLAPFGLPGDAMKPAWGMSETCSGVVYSHALTQEPDTGIHHINKHSLADRVEKSTSEVDSVTFVELGSTIPGVSIRVVDPNNQVVREGKVGRLQIKGTTVTTGYYNNPELNQEVFTSDGWFDTGDLGFILNGKMTITGRAKDIIIIHGINYNNVEIEAIVEEVEGVEASYTAACAARDTYSDTEKIIIFYSSVYTDLDFDKKLEQIKKIERKLVEKMGIKPDLVIPVAREEIPKTSIGKIQRLKLAKLFESGHFYDIVKQIGIALGNESTLPAWFFKPSWCRRPLHLVEEINTEAGRSCLVFTDEAGLSEALITRLEENNCRCIRVKTGDYKKAEDYKGLLDTIENKKSELHDIFYLYSYSDSDSDSRHRDRTAGLYVYHLLYLIQALEGRYEHPLRLFVVSSFGQFAAESDRVDKEKWGIPGFLKSVSLELSWLHCCHLDLEMAASSGNIDTPAEQIVKEWKNPGVCPEVAYRQNRRLLPYLESVDMKKEAALDIPIKRGGVYIVTGGLGGIGTHVCKWLMAHFDTKLIIVGRTPMPEKKEWNTLLKKETLVSRRLRAFLEIESLGGEGQCMYAAGNAADESFWQKVKSMAQSRWGNPIQGVFHLAGYGNLEYHWQVMDEHWVTAETVETFETMFQSKVYGTLALHQLLKENLDSLFAAFSSTTAFFGAATFSAYAAANSYMDGFCHDRRNRGYTNTYCFNWSSWDNVGMSENNPSHMVKAMQMNGYEMISLKQGLDSLLIALQSPQKQLVVGLDILNRNIRKFLNVYPADKQSVKVYYTLEGEKNFSTSSFHTRILDILSREDGRVDTALELFQIDSMPKKMKEGVIDYKQLDAMRGDTWKSRRGLDLPENETEKKLAEIWQKILGKSRIGVLDNFFELGGHSLRATVLASKIHKEFDIVISLGEIFKKPTIRDLAKYIMEAEVETYESIGKVEKRPYYAVSSAQRRLYILQQMDSQSIVYNIPEMLLVEGPLNLDKLKEAFRNLINRHESLRTSFELIDGDPVQKIHKKVEFDIEYYDLGNGGKEIFQNSKFIIHHSFIRPFDLTRPPLLRVGLITLSVEGAATSHILMLDIHHIAVDGISFDIFLNELKALYAGMELPELQIQYKDFAKWQNLRIALGKLKKQETFWLQEFAGEIPVITLPTDYSRPAEQSFEGKTIPFTVDEKDSEALMQMTSAEDTTPYMVLLALFNVFLSKLSGQEDIIVGTPVAGRPHPDVEPLIGMFVNTLAVRNFPEQKTTFKAFLQQIKERTMAIFNNQDYQFEDLVEKLSITRDLSRNPLFDVMFSFQNLEMPSEKIIRRDIPGLQLKPYEFEYKISKFDMTLTVENADVNPAFKFRYCTKLFKEDSIKRFIHYFKHLLSSIVRDPGRRISELEMMSEADKKQVLFDFNDTSTEYVRDKAIHELFEDQAERVGDKVAVIADSTERHTITYKELNRGSNQLAYLLRRMGVDKGEIVGIMVERSLEMVKGLLGILKVGGAYLPLDPEYPDERLNFMIKDSGVSIILTAHPLLAKLPPLKDHVRVVCLGANKPTEQEPDENLDAHVTTQNLAYVIYTSGSTGRPKGVAVPHAGISNRLQWVQEAYGLTSGDRLLQKTPFTFDVSVWEFFWPLQTGAVLVMARPGGHKDSAYLVDVIAKEKITIIHFVPSMLNVFLEDPKISQVRSLKRVISSGEALPVEYQERFFTHLDAELFNLYGPTEASVEVTAYTCLRNTDQRVVPIGRPIANTQIYILDHYLNPVPIGVHGEIHIGGIQLARGYLNNPDLTAEKFNRSYKSYMTYISYKTGDQGRWLPDGNIEFLGRIDQQVKIRGFRIELEEIENLLLKHKDVKEAVVTAFDNPSGDKYLAAYVAFTSSLSSAGGKTNELRVYLSGKLPDFMVPSFITAVEKIPLTPNGKVDRRALPKPEPTAYESYTPPRNKTEEELAALWAEVLGIEKESIGIDSNFFSLGGHSLKGVKLIARIHKKLNVIIPISQIFKDLSIRKLAKYIEGASKEVYTSIEPVEKKEYYAASSIQKRLFILSEMEGIQTPYNLPFAVIIEGKVNPLLFEQTFQQLIKRHESLRTSFVLIGDEPVQIVHENVDFHINYLEAEETEIDRLIVEFVKLFDLSKAPILRVQLVKISEAKYLFLYDMHHIISDGTSMGIFQRDFMRLYEGEGSVSASKLPELRVQYKDFSEWQNNSRWDVRTDMEKKERYWLDQFKGEIPRLDIYTDYPRPEVQSFEGDRITFTVEKELHRRINQLMKETNTTLYMVLLAVYNILLARYTGQEDIIVGTPAAGREHADFENVIGLFINALPMRNYPRGNNTFKEFLNEVKLNTINAYENQAYPFGNLMEKVTVTDDLSRNPIFETELLVQNMEMPEWDIKGLRFIPIESLYDATQVDIAIEAWESEERISFNLIYCTRLFKRVTMERFALFFKDILSTLLDNPDIELEEIKIARDLLPTQSKLYRETQMDFEF
jgi:surfactin family lipopeptide synthetase A